MTRSTCCNDGFTSLNKQVGPFLHLFLSQHEMNFFLSRLAPACPEMFTLLSAAPRLPTNSTMFSKWKGIVGTQFTWMGMAHCYVLSSIFRYNVIIFFFHLLFEGRRKCFFPQSPDFLSHILGLSFNWGPSFSSLSAVRHAFTAIVLGL